MVDITVPTLFDEDNYCERVARHNPELLHRLWEVSLAEDDGDDESENAVIFMDTGEEIQSTEIIEGDESSVNPNEYIKQEITIPNNVKFVHTVHTHPSGGTTASMGDIQSAASEAFEGESIIKSSMVLTDPMVKIEKLKDRLSILNSLLSRQPDNLDNIEDEDERKTAKRRDKTRENKEQELDNLRQTLGDEYNWNNGMLTLTGLVIDEETRKGEVPAQEFLEFAIEVEGAKNVFRARTVYSERFSQFDRQYFKDRVMDKTNGRVEMCKTTVDEVE